MYKIISYNCFSLRGKSTKYKKECKTKINQSRYSFENLTIKGEYLKMN